MSNLMKMATGLLSGDPALLITKFLPQAEKGLMDILQGQTLQEGEKNASILIWPSLGKAFISIITQDENGKIKRVIVTGELQQFVSTFLNQ